MVSTEQQWAVNSKQVKGQVLMTLKCGDGLNII